MGVRHSQSQIEIQQAKDLCNKTHFTKKELASIIDELEKHRTSDSFVMNKEQFKEKIKPFVEFWAAGTLFLERLFDAFDLNHDTHIDLAEFLQGLSIFTKGTPEEKLQLSFKLYDIDHDGFISRKELTTIMNQLYSSYYNEDQSERIQEIVNHIFEDLDVNDDNQLSFTEYQLMALKEPLIVDFLEQFVSETGNK